jgi:hypothetical protein
MQECFHALVLNLHQPAGNLEELLTHREWEAKEIRSALDRIPRSLWDMEHVRAGDTPIRPTFVTDYLDRYGAHGLVNVRTGVWNMGCYQGRDFVQWTAGQAQRDALARIAEVSRAVHDARRKTAQTRPDDPAFQHEIEESTWRLLRAQTSCNFYWGETWLRRCHADLDAALHHLDRVPMLAGA